MIIYSVIIPVKDNKDGLAITLNSIFGIIDIEKNEVIVVNDGASTDISDFIKINYFHKVRELKIKETHGQFYARNRGVEIANGNWIVFIDDSMDIPLDVFSQSNKLMHKYDYITFNVQIKPIKNESVFEKFFRLSSFPCYQHFIKDRFGITAFLMVRKEAFQKVGGFDERLESGGDHVFGKQIHKAGYKQVYIKDIMPIHAPKSLALYKADKEKYMIGTERIKRFYPSEFANHGIKFKSTIKMPFTFIKKITMYHKHPFYYKLNVSASTFVWTLMKYEIFLNYLKLKVAFLLLFSRLD